MRKKFEYSIGQKANRALLRRLNYRQSLRSDDARHYRVYKRRARQYREGGSNRYFIADSRDGRIVEDNLTIEALSSLEQGHILVGVDGIKPSTERKPVDLSKSRGMGWRSKRAAQKKQAAERVALSHLHGPVRHIVINGVPTA